VTDVAVILNPRAGHGADPERQREITDLFAALGREATVYVPGEGQDVGERSRAAVTAGCRVLVAAGGDGTVSAAAAAWSEGKYRWESSRSGHSITSPRTWASRWSSGCRPVAAQGVVRTVDVGEVNGRYFLNNSSIGVYPRIVELRERYQSGGMSKWVAALWASLAVMRRRPFVAVRIQVDDEPVVRRTPFVFIGNNEYTMEGLRGVRRESLTAGHLAVYVMHAKHRASLLRLAGEVLIRGADRVQELDLFRVTTTTVETRRRRIQVALDGEVAMLEFPLEYRIHAAALRVMASAP
jgi:Sphingosine kinase and enzymes related to eukaryotic diacylglycerol kinase